MRRRILSARVMRGLRFIRFMRTGSLRSRTQNIRWNSFCATGSWQNGMRAERYFCFGFPWTIITGISLWMTASVRRNGGLRPFLFFNHRTDRITGQGKPLQKGKPTIRAGGANGLRVRLYGRSTRVWSRAATLLFRATACGAAGRRLRPAPNGRTTARGYPAPLRRRYWPGGHR